MGSSFGTGPLDKPPVTIPDNKSPQTITDPSKVNLQVSTITDKTQTISRRFFNYMTQGVTWGIAKVAETIAFSTGAIKKTTAVNLAYLEGFTGNENLGELLEVLSLSLSNKISGEFINDGALKTFINSDKPFVDNLVKCLVTEVATNVAKELYAQGKPTDTFSIISTIIETFNACSQKVLNSPDLMTDPIVPSFKEAAEEASVEFLKLVLPYGKHELPIRWGINSLVWNKLKNVFLPNVLIDLARKMKPFNSLSKKEELKSLTQGEFLLQLVQQSKILMEDVGVTTFQKTETQKYLAKRLIGLLSLPDRDTSERLTQWVEELLSNADASDPKFIYYLQQFIGDQTEAVFTSILYNLVTSLDPDNQGFGLAIRRFVEIAGTTFTTQHPLIQEAYTRIVEQNGVPETNDEYIKLFLPIVSEIEKLSGTESLLKVLPEQYRDKARGVVQKLLSNLIAKSYQAQIAPLIHFFVKAQESSDDVIPEKNVNSQEIGPLTEYVAKLAAVKKAVFAQMIAKKIVGKLPDLEQQFSTLIQNELKDNTIEPQVLSVEDQRAIPDEEIQVLLPEDVQPTDQEVVQFIPKKEEIVLSPQHQELASWLETWLIQQYDILEATNDPILKTLWKTVDAVVDDLLSLLLVGKGVQSSNIPLGIKVSDYAEILLQFIEGSGDAIRNHFLTIVATGESPENDETFVARFTPLCETLSKKLMLEDKNAPMPKFVQKIALTYFNKEVPLLLAKQYRQFLAPIAAMVESKQRLKTLLGGEQATEETAKTVEQVEKLCEVLGDKITGSIETYAFKLLEKHTGFDLTKFTLPKFQQLRDAYIKKVVQAFLLELMVNYLNKVDAEGKPLNTLPLSKLLNNLASMVEKHLRQNPEFLFQAAWNEDEKLQKEALRNAFAPMAKDLINLFRSEESSKKQASTVTLPLPNLLEGLWSEIEQTILPDALGEMFLDVTRLTTKKAEMQQTAKTIAGTTHIPEACRVLGHWVADFLPPYLFREREDVVQTLYASVTKALGKSGTPSAVEIVGFLETHGEEYKKRICSDLFSFFSPDDKVAELAGPITKEYVETVLLQAFNGIVQRVQEKESTYKNQGDFLLNIAIRLITIIQSHFRTINTAASNRGVPTYKMEHQQHLAAFGRHLHFGPQLHAGVPNSAQAIEAKKIIKECLQILTRERKRLEKLTDPEKIKACKALIEETRERLVEAKTLENAERLPYFTDMAKTMMELTGIKGPDDLPFPSPLKEELWDLVEQDLLPMVFMELLGSVLEPKNLNAILISGLEMLNEALDRVPDPEEEPYVAPEDKEQIRLNIACGGLIQQLVSIVPHSIIKTAFKIDRIKVMSAESIGAAVRKALVDNLTLMTLINKGIESGLPNLHPGVWQETENGAVFMGEGEEGKIKFTMPLNADEVEISERKALQDFEKSRVKLKKIMVQSAHKLVKQNIEGFFKWPLIKFKRIWDKCVNKVFGKHSDAVRQYFNWLGTKAVFRLIETVLSIASIPFRMAAGFFLDLYLGIRAEQLIKNLELDIHENLLYKLTDALLAALKSNNNVLDKELIDQMVADAEKFDGAERLKVLLYQQRFAPNPNPVDSDQE